LADTEPEDNIEIIRFNYFCSLCEICCVWN